MESVNTNVTDNAKAMLKNAKTLKLHTGNLVIRSRLKKKCPSSPSEELQDCIRATLIDWLSTTQLPSEGGVLDTVDCSIPEATEAIKPEEREELKVSGQFIQDLKMSQSGDASPEWFSLYRIPVKLFLCETDQSSIPEALEMACQTLAVSQLDSVIVAPRGLPEGEVQTLAHLQPAWEELEALVGSEKIAAIGTSDLDKDLLEQLYKWSQVKPSSNQVNLASCCVMPPDLTAFAKDFDIQLLTHSDPKELMSASAFQEAVQESTKEQAVADWRLEWVLRYSIIVKSRGIIRAKGYLVHARKAGL